MPLVRVDWYPGRSQVTKDVLSRRILEAFAGAADCPYPTVQIIFTEVAHSDWVLGPSMVPDGAAPGGAAQEPTYAAWLDLTVDTASRDTLSEWYRESLLPELSTVSGFLGIDLYELTETRYRLCIRWVGEPATSHCYGPQASGDGVWVHLETFASDLRWQRGAHRRA